MNVSVFTHTHFFKELCFVLRGSIKLLGYYRNYSTKSSYSFMEFWILENSLEKLQITNESRKASKNRTTTN